MKLTKEIFNFAPLCHFSSDEIQEICRNIHAGGRIEAYFKSNILYKRFQKYNDDCVKYRDLVM